MKPRTFALPHSLVIEQTARLYDDFSEILKQEKAIRASSGDQDFQYFNKEKTNSPKQVGRLGGGIFKTKIGNQSLNLSVFGKFGLIKVYFKLCIFLSNSGHATS